MSVLATMDHKHGPPSSSESDIAELTAKMSLTHLQDNNGNNLDLGTGDLSSSETEEKDSGFSSEEGPEYELADPIDRLAFLSERDVDSGVLEEFGPGEKRCRDQSLEGEREEGVPSKRTPRLATTTGICPPPEQVSFLRSPPIGSASSGRKLVSVCGPNGHQQLLFTASGHAGNDQGYVVTHQGSMGSQFGNRSVSVSERFPASDGVTAWPEHSPPIPPNRESGIQGPLPSYPDQSAWLKSLPPAHTSMYPWSSSDGPNPMPAQEGSSASLLPTDVSTDGSSTALDEKNRQIQQIVKHLILTSPQGNSPSPVSAVSKAVPPVVDMQDAMGCTGPVSSRAEPTGSSVPSRPVLSGPPLPSPAGLKSSPSGWKGGQPELPSQGGGISAARESQAQVFMRVLGPPLKSLPNLPPDKCVGPPSMQAKCPPVSRQPKVSVGSPQAIPTMPPAGQRLAQTGGKEAGVFQTAGPQRVAPVCDLAATSTGVLREDALTFTPPALKQAACGPDKGTFLHTVMTKSLCHYQRQDSSSSEASTSSTRSVRSSAGQTTHTCLSNKATCGAVVTCNDISPPHPPSPFSPSSSASRDSVQANSPAAAAMTSGPESPDSAHSNASVCSYPPAASPYSTPSHACPSAYSFPPTPESDCPSVKSDCHSPRGRKPQDSLSSMSSGLPQNTTTEQGVCPGGTRSMIIGSVGLPTPPHAYSGDDPASPSQPRPLPHPPVHIPPSPSLPAAQGYWPCFQPWQCTENAHPYMGSVTHVVISREEEEEEEESGGQQEEEEEGVDYEERVVEEVLERVCDEHGEWQTDDNDGDKFLHSLSGMRKEGVAVEYLHCLQHKPGFLQALNSFNRSLETPLYCAVCLRKLALVAHMLQVGADVNIQCRYGDQAHTPLHRAVEKGDFAMVDILLRSDRINLNARRGSDHLTALMAAIAIHMSGDPRHDRLRIINRIVEEDDRLDLQARDPRSGKTALMMAIETKDIRVVDAILNDLDLDRARQLINMQNRAGNSAVHLAAGLHDVSPHVKEHMLRKLIGLGGDTNKKNNEGDTPKHWAQHVIDKVAKLK